jgi:hypothetical protein
MEWLKSHRGEYGGQYIALDGDQLLSVGPNYRTARERALVAGKPNAIVTYLQKPDEIAELGGWVEASTFLHGVDRILAEPHHAANDRANR